ncbi:MAG: hypothetical protein H6719_34135 [Sandaracinaceae bacterium]|nr:hypothetical protein [Sandaracinaceae bacterium]
MRRHLGCSFVALMSGCTLLAPFGDLSTGDVDGSVVGGDGGVCLTRPMTPADDPFPTPTGIEICNRLDDDGDGRVDRDTLVVEAVRGVGGLTRVLDARGMRGGAEDRIAIVASVGDGIAESLQLAEVFLPEGFDPIVSTLVEGEVVGFDGARVRDGYAIAYSVGGEILLGVASDCNLTFGERTTVVATGAASHVRVAAITPVNVLVTWQLDAGGIGAALVDVRTRPSVEAMHDSLLTDVGYTAGRHPEPLVDGSGNGQVTFTARDGSGAEDVFVRPVGGALGAVVTVTFDPFYGEGPFADPVGATTSNGAVWIAFDVEAVSGPAYITASTGGGRQYGPPAEILAIASSDTPDVGVLLEFAGTPLIERVGPTVEGSFSQDTDGPRLALERWRDLVGLPQGRTRYVGVATRGGGALAIQRVGCFE